MKTGRLLSPAVLLLVLVLERAAAQDPWSWRCEGDLCVREEARSDQARTSLNTCLLSCSPASLLWPRPRNFTLGKFSPHLSPHSVLLPDLQFSEQERLSSLSTWRGSLSTVLALAARWMRGCSRQWTDRWVLLLQVITNYRSLRSDIPADQWSQ